MTESDGYTQPMARPDRRRRKLVAGLFGLAVLLGGGAYVTTNALTHDDETLPEPVALAPVVVPEDSPSATPSSSPTASPRATTASPSASPSESATTSAEQRVKAARSSAAAAGFPVQRPVPQTGHAADDSLQVTNSGSLDEGGTMRVVSARYDLTGQRERAWAADDGVAVGKARCTQNFKFSNTAEAAERPTMLLCWRTSGSRSVVTVAVTKDGRPAKSASAAMIDKQWDKLQ